MAEKVIMKFFTNGIIVKLPDDTSSFSDIRNELRGSFEKSSGFFKNASLVLRLEGKKLSENQIKQIIKDIKEVTKIDIVCVICSDLGHNTYFEKYLKNRPQNKEIMEPDSQIMDSYLENTSDYMVVKKLLREGDCIETDRDLLIFGNVPKGALIYSKKNVIVLGTIYGTVFAGSEEEPNHFIVALSFQPENIRIGKISDKRFLKSVFSIGGNQGRIAYVKDNKIKIEEIDFNTHFSELFI